MPPTLNRGGKGYIFASHKLAKFPIRFVLVRCEIREFCGEMSFKYQFYSSEYSIFSLRET